MLKAGSGMTVCLDDTVFLLCAFGVPLKSCVAGEGVWWCLLGGVVTTHNVPLLDAEVMMACHALQQVVQTQMDDCAAFACLVLRLQVA